ncbi:MAG: S-methyl-5-thioribose-1-phosphate isomerase [Candidatus Methanofastidiosia archaeon]
MNTGKITRTIYFEDDAVKIIDQTKLPSKLVIHTCVTVKSLIEAITILRVRGAPALGVAGAYGVLLSAIQHKEENCEQFYMHLREDAKAIAEARPTAVNLQWGVAAQEKLLDASAPIEKTLHLLKENAKSIADKDLENNKMIGKNGASLIEQNDSILTHCNAGALACVGYGTALGIIRFAYAEGKKIHIYVDETRPLCQGSRLTAWELLNENIPSTLITDNIAGFLMKQGKIQKVIVGADRIAANGDVANKIGTYSLSVLACHHNIPFIVAAPTSTIDFSCNLGEEIPIEERDGNEIIYWHGIQNAPESIHTYNPAFDITPANNISAIVTEKGIATQPFIETLKQFKP